MMETAVASPPGQVELMKAAFRYQNALVSYAGAILRDRALAEDVVQEAFLVLLEKWEEYRPEFGVYPWVRRMVYYKAREARRDRRRERPVGDQALDELVRDVVDARFDEEWAERHDPLMKAYEECMSKMGPEAADIMIRYYGRGQSGQKIAEALRRSVNAVWLSLSRIRKSLRHCISQRCQVHPT
jgi:RNA polymerase sigma-70 factor (ECF subfamily)